MPAPVKFSIDKKSVVPFYLQLKKQIEQNIVTNVFLPDHRLPSIHALAGELSVNIDTIRKAYKLLESEGLISMRRAKGTCVTHNERSPWMLPVRIEESREGCSSFRKIILCMMKDGESESVIRKEFNDEMKEILKEQKKQVVIFAECGLFPIEKVSRELESVFNLRIVPCQISDLKAMLSKMDRTRTLRAIVTTEFHIREVRKISEGLPVECFVLNVGMSAESRADIDAFGENKKFVFVCQKKESIPIYNNLIKNQLGKKFRFSIVERENREKMISAIKSAGIILAPPYLCEEIKTLVPEKRLIVSVFNQVDPISVRVIKDRLFS
jgi:DNA-binding transcriptional regulator YhcF (GntR family)